MLTPTKQAYTFSLHDALPISFDALLEHAAGAVILGPTHLFHRRVDVEQRQNGGRGALGQGSRSEEHTSELQSRGHLVCRLRPGKKRALARLPNINDEQ